MVIYFRDNIYIIKTLKEFQFVDEYGKDQGANVRQKAKDITNLLQDESRLREQRRSRAHMRDRMVRGGPGGEEEEDLGEDENALRRSRRKPSGAKDEDELKRAIEESKRSLALEQAKKGAMTAEERDLAQAIRLSEEEEAKRAKALEDANANSLFDEQNQYVRVSSSYSIPSISYNSNRVSPQQPTNPFPFLDPTPYATGLQVQPQFTSFNPYQQQAQQEAMQQEYLRQQQEWMRQQQEQQALQALQQQQQQQQEEWMRQQQMMQMMQQQQQPIMAQPTGFGSNNPFAPASSPPPPMPSFNSSPSTSSGPSFNLQGTYESSPAPPSFSTSSTSSPAPSSNQGSLNGPPRKTRADEEHAHLANLFANRDDGQDTFGNIGQMRYVLASVIMTALWWLLSKNAANIGTATRRPVGSWHRKRAIPITRSHNSSSSSSRAANSPSSLSSHLGVLLPSFVFIDIPECFYFCMDVL